MRKVMLQNIVLSGGTTMMPGFAQRIKSTLFHHFEGDFTYSSLNHHANIVAELNRDISTWVGGSMVASMSSFEKVFIRKEEYIENGEDRLTLFSKIF